MAERQLTTDQLLAKMVSDLDHQWREHETFYKGIFIDKAEFRQLSTGQALQIRRHYTKMCEALCGMQIQYNRLKRVTEDK